jgi:hypothetical protein
MIAAMPPFARAIAVLAGSVGLASSACAGDSGALASGDAGPSTSVASDASSPGDGEAAARPPPPVGSYPSEVLADKPLAYYRFGEASGDVARDRAERMPGGRYTGVTLGVPGAIAGDTDTAVRLDGMSAWVSLADAFDFAGKVPFTIELWARPQLVDELHRGLFTKEVAGGGVRQGYLLTLQLTAGLAFERAKDGLTASVMTRPLPAGVYSHVVVTFDGASLRLYVDGALAAGPIAATNELPDTTANAVAGARVSGNTPLGNAAHFRGDLDELAFYDQALSAARVAAHHRAGKRLD